MTFNQFLKNIHDKIEEKSKYEKPIFLLAIIPASIVSFLIFNNISEWNIGWTILFPMFVVGFYLIMVLVFLEIVFMYSTYEVVYPKVNKKIKIWNFKINRLFNAPNRIDVLEQSIKSQPESTSKIDILLKQIAEDYQHLDNKKMPEVISDIYKEITLIKEHLYLNKFPCLQCGKSFEAIPQDHLCNVAMRDRCSVCDMLDIPMFKRWRYDCEHCGEINYIFWHNKELHSREEIRMAEGKFHESD